MQETILTIVEQILQFNIQFYGCLFLMKKKKKPVFLNSLKILLLTVDFNDANELDGYLEKI